LELGNSSAPASESVNSILGKLRCFAGADIAILPVSLWAAKRLGRNQSKMGLVNLS
jgi:hypothetical protein